MFHIIFLVIFVFIIITFVKGIAQWIENNNSPVVQHRATVVKKTEDVTTMQTPCGTDANGAPMFMPTQDTTYFVIFLLENGETRKMSVGRKDFQQISEGDKGKLTVQGTRYLGFE